MAATSHFASASLSMPVSVRVEVFDTRASASKKTGTPLAKFRMRTPASTTFGNLGQAVAQRYMKESAGTITVAPRVVCVLDKEDCTFDLDDSIDIVVPNEAIRFVLDRQNGTAQQQPVSHSGIAQPQLNCSSSNHVNGPISIQPGRTAFPTSRQPALLKQRLSTAPVAAQFPLPELLTRQPAGITNGFAEQHKATPRSPGLSSKKRDPYEIDSEEDANDPPPRHSSSREPQLFSSAPRTNRATVTTSGRPQTDATRLPSKNGQVAATRPAAHRGEPASPASVTPRRPANPDEKALSRERSIQQVEAGAEVVSISGTDSKGAPSPTSQQVPANHSTLLQSSQKSVVPPGADVVSIADSGSYDDSDSDEISSPPRLSTQRSLEKRSYHTVNEHINFQEKQRSNSRNADPTPILLKNSRGVFPVYRRGEGPSSEYGGPLSEELGHAQPLPSRSSAPHTVPRNLPVAASTNGISQGPRSDPISWENFEEEFAGFDELSDFEIAPRARAVTSQPNHRTQTPSRSSLRVTRGPGSNRHPFSSMPPRSSPLESKQARLPQTRAREGTLVTPVTQSKNTQSQPQRGSNNRASREPSVVELPEAPVNSSPKQSRNTPVDKPLPTSSQSRGIGGNEIRQWIASRRSSNLGPVKSSPVPMVAAAGPLKSSQAIREVKSMTELRIKSKAKPSEAQVPDVFYVEDDVRQDVYNSATSSIEIPDDKPALPRHQPPAAARKPTFSRASSCVSSQSGYSGSKRGRIPSSPFHPGDSIASQDRQELEDGTPKQHFGRAYSRRVRAIFSDASESSDGHAVDESVRDTQPKPFRHPINREPADVVRMGPNKSPANNATRSENIATVTGSKVVLTAQRTSHPKWKPWWHPWGWINRYETEFFVGGIIANGPFEGYHLTNEKAGVYIEGCEAPSEDLLAAEDLICKKDETRLMQRRERRRTRRLAGDYHAHEDDGFDSAEELAREFGESDDICKGLSIANEIEISCTMDTDSEEDEESSSSSEESEDVDMKDTVPVAVVDNKPIEEDSDSNSDGDEEGSTQQLPPSRKSPLKQAKLDDKVVEKHVRMERARQYALTGEVSSQSQSQDELAVTSHNAADIKSLARASEATSAHSTTTSVLIARQLGVSSPPSNQELALLMSSSPTKAPPKSGLTEEGRNGSEAGDSSDSSVASISARLPSLQVETQSSESQVEVRETPIKARPAADNAAKRFLPLVDNEEEPKSQAEASVSGLDKDRLPSPEVEDVTKAVRSAKNVKKRKGKKGKDTKYKKLTRSSTPKPKAELIVEFPMMSQEQRSSFSEIRSSTNPPSPPQLRSFENLNNVGTNDVSHRMRASTPVVISDDDDVVEYVLRESPKWLNSNLQITSPMMSFACLTGDSDHEDDTGSMSPTVARSKRKRRVTFGDDPVTVDREGSRADERQISQTSLSVQDQKRALNSADIDFVDTTSKISEPTKPRRGSKQSPIAPKRDPVDVNLDLGEHPVEVPSPSSKPPKARRVPVVSFDVSDSEEEHIVLSLDGLPNVVEGVRPRKRRAQVKEWGSALSQHAVTPVPPPRIPVNLSALPGPGRYLSASQPTPMKPSTWPKPRVVTPIPPPIIPPTSDSELYKARPQIIEIDSTEPSDSKGDSDVVMIPRPPMQLPPPTGKSSQASPSASRSRKSKPQATVAHEPTPSPELVLSVLNRPNDLVGEPSSGPQLTPPPAEEIGMEQEHHEAQLSTRARKKAEKAKRKKVEKSKNKKEKKQRRASRGNVAIAAALIASPRTRTIIASMDKASGGRRSSGNFQQPMFSPGKKDKKSRRKGSSRAIPDGPEAAAKETVPYEPTATVGRKRKHRRHSTDQQQADIPTEDGNGASTAGMLAEAVKRAKRRKLGSPADNIIKREKDSNGGAVGTAVDDGGFLQSSSSSHGNISSSHPSLISPPTTSRPSSAGSRGSR